MARVSAILVSILMLIPMVGICFADAPPATAPKVLNAPPRILVYPFTPVGDPGAYAWIGTGIQQSLLVEVSRPGFVAMTGPSTQPNEAATDPVAAASKAGAAVVIFGSYQILNTDVRCTGEVIDTASGRSMGALSATGQLRELFKIEDDLGRQLQHILQPPGAVASDQSTTQPQEEPGTSPTSGYYYTGGDSYVPSTSYVPTYYPDYGYAYPFYSYYYPFSTSIIIGSSGFNCFHNHGFSCNNHVVHFHNNGFVHSGTFVHGGVTVSGSGSFARQAPISRFNGGGMMAGGGFHGPSAFAGGRAPVMGGGGMVHAAGVGGGGFGGFSGGGGGFGGHAGGGGFGMGGGGHR
jgi:TolB-like protein